MGVPKGAGVLLKGPEPVGTQKTPTPRLLCPLARALPWIWAVTRGPGSGLRLGRGGRENGRHDDIYRLTLQLLAFILLSLVFLQQAGQHGRVGRGAGRRDTPGPLRLHEPNRSPPLPRGPGSRARTVT